MILSCLTLELVPGSFDTLEAVFARHAILERAIKVEGCRALYLTADADHGGRAYVVGVWDDRAAYERWLNHPQRGVGAADLHALMADTWDSSAPGDVWNVLRVAEHSLGNPQPSGLR
jgi:heme-degrading monooxygenase HmoA